MLGGRVLTQRHPALVEPVAAAQFDVCRTVDGVKVCNTGPTPTAGVYTVEIPSAVGERVLENNRRSVLVEPPGRKRRLLVVEGAPGFEHSFIKRALMLDPGIEVDSVVRKGRDAQGDSTFFVQSVSDRASQLATGFPDTRAALYQYDAVILANIEPDSLSRVQLEMIADFVDVRGGRKIPYSLKLSLETTLPNQPNGWVAEIPAIPGCYALMPTQRQAIAELRLVLEMIADEYQDRGLLPPSLNNPPPRPVTENR